MKLFDYEEPSKYSPMIDRLLAGTTLRRPLSPEISVTLYWQSEKELQQHKLKEVPRSPVLEEFVSFSVDGKTIYKRLQAIKNKDLPLKEEMAKTQARRILIETVEVYSSWENQYGFESSAKAERLGNALEQLYDELCTAVKCETLNGDETTFQEDQELIDETRSRFESALIELGFTGVSIPKRSILKRILKAFKS